jgi:hypothetical protein
VSQPFEVGAYAHQRLNLAANGKAHGRNAKASNRTWEIRPSGIIGGLCQEDEKSSCCTKDGGGPFGAALYEEASNCHKLLRS